MKQSEKALIASCGGYCRGCAFHYLAYVDEDERLKQAEALSRQLNMEIRLDEIGCLGCHGSKKSSWCVNCSIRKCTEEKGILTCASCDIFPCDKLERFYDEENTRYGSETRYGDESKANILRQRKIGLEKWLEEIKSQDLHQK